MDFMQDQTFDGSKLRVLTIVDAATRASPAIDVRPIYGGVDAGATLARVTALYGLPSASAVIKARSSRPRWSKRKHWAGSVRPDVERPRILQPGRRQFGERSNRLVSAQNI